MRALDPRQKAERISAIFRARQPIDILPAELIPADLDEAYQVRGAYEAIESAAGRGAVIGYKIGLTTPIMQKMCGVDEPCFGAIFANEVHHCRAELPVDAYCRLGIETEIAVRLGEDLRQGVDRVRVEAAVESCMAAIELLEDLRHDYKRLSAAAMVAGNVWNAGVVLGAPANDWRQVDLARVTSRLTINGREIGSGKGSDVMGNPLNALSWLADKLASVGTPLRRGMIVMTGSMVPIQFPATGTTRWSRSAGSAVPNLLPSERGVCRRRDLRMQENRRHGQCLWLTRQPACVGNRCCSGGIVTAYRYAPGQSARSSPDPATPRI